MTYPSSDLVILRTCASLPEAQILKLQLENSGLHPEIKDEHMQTIASHLSTFLGGIILLLPEDEVEKAHEILQANAFPSEDSDQEKKEIQPNRVDQKSLYAKRSALFGVFLVPILPTLYSIYLSIQCVLNYPILSTKGKKDFWIATSINLLALLAIYFLFKTGEFLSLVNFP